MILKLGLGITQDYLFNGSTPTAAGQMTCSIHDGRSGTGTFPAARWQDPASTGCFSDLVLGPPTGTITAATHQVGWSAYPDNTGASAERYVFGDTGTGVETFFGGALQDWSYHGMTFDLGEGGTIPGRSTTEDFVVTLHNTSSNITLAAGTSSGNVTLDPGTTGKVSIAGNMDTTAGTVTAASINETSGTLTTATLKVGSSGATVVSASLGTFVNNSPSAQTAGQCFTNTVTPTGATITTGAVCSIGTPAVGTSTIITWCSYDGANTIAFHQCNVGTASATNTAGTYYCYCLNH
jgi:hypothetical protein